MPKGPEPEPDPGRGVDGGAVVEGEHEERGEMDGQPTEGCEGGGSKEPTPPKDRQYQLLQEQQQQQYYQDPQYTAQTFQDTGVQYQEQVIQYQDPQQYHKIGLQQHLSADQGGGVQHQQQYQDVQYMEVQNILPQDQYSTRHLPTLEEQPRGEFHKIEKEQLITLVMNITLYTPRASTGDGPPTATRATQGKNGIISSCLGDNVGIQF